MATILIQLQQRAHSYAEVCVQRSCIKGNELFGRDTQTDPAVANDV